MLRTYSLRSKINNFKIISPDCHMHIQYWILDMCPLSQNVMNNTKNITIVTEKIEFLWQEQHRLILSPVCDTLYRVGYTESRKHSIFPTNHIRIYQIFLLLAGRDNQIWVLNLTILLPKKQKKVRDSLGQLWNMDVIDSLRLLSEIIVSDGLKRLS